MNDENLRPCEYKLSQEESKRGGINSGESRRRKKEMRQQLEMLLSLPLKNQKLKSQINDLGVDDEEIDNQLAITISLYQQALKGNTKAYEIIRDTLGEKPIERVQQLEPPTITIERPKDD